MKKVSVLFIVLLFTISVYAKAPIKNTNKLPTGVFRKNWRGNIVQYDNNNKKLYTYKMKNGKIVSVK